MHYSITSYFSQTENPMVVEPIMHSHEDYEIYYFIEGKIDFLVEGKLYPLSKGDIMIMRKGEMHINKTKQDIMYRRIVLNFEISEILNALNSINLLNNFNMRPLGEYNHYSVKQFPQNHWLYYLNHLCNAKKDNTKLCYLLPLLQELNDCYEIMKNYPSDGESNLSLEISKYINDNLSSPLMLDNIADRFYLSKTHINRIFKAQVGTTVGNYIKLKRLYLAKELISNGNRPTDVYSKCGYNDYTTFFRAYKKQFDHSPTTLFHSNISP